MVKHVNAWLSIQSAAVLHILAGVIVAHRLVPLEFGRFAAIGAMLTLMAACLNPLINELSRVVARAGGVSPRLLLSMSITGWLPCVLLGVGSALSVTPLSGWEWVVILLLPVLFVPSSWVQSMFTGSNRMVEFGIVQGLGALLKLSVIVLFVSSGSSFATALVGYVAGFFLVLCIGFYRNRGVWCDPESSGAVHKGVITGFFLLAAPFALDQILVQAFHPAISGSYAAVMTYSKTALLVAAPALTVAYGGVLQCKPGTEHSFFSPPVLLRIVGISGVLCFLLWAVAPWAFPVLLGPHYARESSLVGIGLTGVGLHIVSYAILQALVTAPCKKLLMLLGVPVVLQFVLVSQTADVDMLVRVSVIVFLVQSMVALVLLRCRWVESLESR